MKRHPMLVLQLMVTVILIGFFSNCDKEKATRTYTWYEPVYKTLTEVRAGMKSGPAQALKHPGKIYIYGNYIFLNEQNEGIHIIDNTQPAAPKRISFIPIPGNVDLAVNGNTLYADSYSDLVTFDISNPQAVVVKKFTSDAFPNRIYYYSNYNSRNPDSIKIPVSWIRHDTTLPADQYPRSLLGLDYIASSSFASSAPGKSGIGGSMARFTLLNNYLYTVTDRELYAFDISTPQDPQFVKKSFIDNQLIETIYPFKNKLFIGSTQGMFIYDVSTPGNPVKQAQFTHARSCDPVIADDNTAYVTLRSGTFCGGNINQLEAINITDIFRPTLIKTYSMTNPFGLGKDGNVLFICDGKDGVKVYDAAQPADLKLIKQISGMETYDVIAWNKKALVVAKDGLYQFDYSNVNQIRLLSKISLN
ncbi:LVIVD repeat-containing protein [Longitalea luteola]|uniref:LVIVD repeat-containing protein n=1 Tax=Longitalea luteola TaxID=2812563 RepID=UPI001A966E3E|nr:hypothetical protein [Longitalea luteola]